MNSRCLVLLCCAALALLAGCASRPPTPDWQMNAHASMQRTLEAYLSGDARLETLEFDRARGDIARTGRLELMARAELMRCAARVASLVFDACPGFEPLAADAGEADRAYAAYLQAAPLSTAHLALLPETQRAAISNLGDAAALARLDDPLARLVAAGVALRAGRASPATMALAADTASAQGWRRPLLAWLGAQLQRAEALGDRADAERLKRRIALVQQAPG